MGTFAELQTDWNTQWTTLLGLRNDTVWMDTGKVHGYNDGFFNTRGILDNTGNQRPKFFWDSITDRIGDIQGGSACLDRLAQYQVEEIGIAAPGILSADPAQQPHTQDDKNQGDGQQSPRNELVPRERLGEPAVQVEREQRQQRFPRPKSVEAV